MINFDHYVLLKYNLNWILKDDEITGVKHGTKNREGMALFIIIDG